MAFLIDTDWLIYYLRGEPRFRNILVRLAQAARLATSPVSLAELHAGSRGPEEGAAIEELRTWLEVLPVDEETVTRIVAEARALRGQEPGIADHIIACTALRHGFVVLTENVRHFGRFDGLVVRPMKSWSPMPTSDH